jgi:hypothetical protein
MTFDPDGAPRRGAPAPTTLSRPVLRGASAAAAPQQAVSAATGPDDRRPLLLLSVPLLAVAALCFFSFVKREALDPLFDPPFGAMSRSQARQVAGALCTRLTGEPARPTDASRQAAFSCRRKRVVREWEVVCDTADGGQYLLRLNADSGAVYAVNRLDRRADNPQAGGYAIGSPAVGATPPAAPPASEAEEEARLSGSVATPVLTRAEAEASARRYLALIGVSSDGLRVVGEPDCVSGGEGGDPAADRGASAAAASAPSACASPSGSCLWNFTFRRRVPGVGDRLLKVSVDGRDGELEHVWNPVSAL